MTKLGIFVGEKNWTFFHELYAYLAEHYKADLFKERSIHVPLFERNINGRLFQNDVQGILKRNDVCFFEWASDLLVHASHMPKLSPIIVRLHSFELYTWAPKVAWKNVDKVILVSHAMEKKFLENFPDCKGKTLVIQNGIALDRYYPTYGRQLDFHLGMVVRISPVKRVYEIILMLNNLIQSGYDAHLHIAGAPSDDARYAVAVYRLVEKLKLGEHVHFYGHVNDVASWLKKIDIFISNSYWEGHQVALIEAMAGGCCSFSHFWDGAEEVLPPAHLYVDENDLQAKLIEYYQQSEAERLSRQKEMRKLACERFDLEKTKQGIREAIDSLL